MSDVAATKALGFVPPWDFASWSPVPGAYRPEEAAAHDERLSRGQRNWEAVIRDWSLRWGDRVRGWWFDGCYYADRMYRHPDAPNFQSFGAAARAGNPQSIVAWNCGVYYPLRAMDADEDYTAGEVNEPERVDPPGPRVDHDQFHVLSFLGTFWGPTPTVRFTPEEAVAHTRAVTDFGGVFTWDTPFTATGQIRGDALTVLKAVGTAMAARPGAPLLRPVTVAATPQETPVLTAGGPPAAGAVTLRLGNPWDIPIAGRVSLTSATLDFPAGAVHEYALAPGTTVARTVPVRIRDTTTPCFQFMVSRPGVRPSTYPFAVQWELAPEPLAANASLDDLAKAGGKAWPLGDPAGHPLATVRFALSGNRLGIALAIYDRVMRENAEMPWDGSCAELFFAAAPQAPVTQLFLLPATPRGPARILRARPGGRDDVTAAVPVTTWPVDGGYGAALFLPVPWLLGTAASAGLKQLLAEVGVTAAPEPGPFVRGRLFGNYDAHLVGSQGFAKLIFG